MRVNIGDCRLFVDVEGPSLVPDGPTMRERPTLIAMHGGPGFDHSSFKPRFGAGLSDVAQILYYDHRGQGRSDRCAPEQWNFAQWADDVVALCDALGIEKPIVYGVSFGGMVGLHYAIRHPQHASKAILDSTAATLDIESMFPVFERLGGVEAVDAARTFWADPSEEAMGEYLRVCMPLYNRHRPDDADIAFARTLETANFDLFRHWLLGEQQTFDLRAELSKVERPTLLLAGEDDPVTPVPGARLIAEGIGDNCQLEVFEDCGHGVWRDQPEAAFASMRRFIEG